MVNLQNFNFVQHEFRPSRAEYNEDNFLRAGPVSVKKMLETSDPLLCDFTDVDKKGDKEAMDLKVREARLEYPFRYEVEKHKEKQTLFYEKEVNHAP